MKLVLAQCDRGTRSCLEQVKYPKNRNVHPKSLVLCLPYLGMFLPYPGAEGHGSWLGLIHRRWLLIIPGKELEQEGFPGVVDWGPDS